MATYYYATVRTFVTDSGGGHNDCYTWPLVTQQSTATGTGNIIWFVVDLFSTTNSSFGSWAATVPSTGGSTPSGSTLVSGNNLSVKVLLNTTDPYIVVDQIDEPYTNPIDKLASIIGLEGTMAPDANGVYTVWDGSWSSFFSTHLSSDNVNSHIIFNITHKGGVEGGTHQFAPNFTITTVDPGSGTTIAVTNNYIFFVGQPLGTPGDYTSTVAPTVGFTSKVTDPPFNKAAILGNSVIPAGSTISAHTWIKGMGANSGYWALQIQIYPSGAMTAYTCAANGQGLVQLVAGTPPPLTATVAKKVAWTKTNTQAYQKQIQGQVTPTSAGTSPLNAPFLTTIPSGIAERYNPPPNKISRGPSLGERIDAFNGAGQKVSPTYLQNMLQSSRRERGRIIQDANGAGYLNNQVSNTSLPRNKTDSNLWGFRFMYNPQTISYSTTSNNSVDWTLGSKDPATLLAGNQTVTVELYLNRIIDMSFLKDLKNDKSSASKLQEYYTSPIGSSGLQQEAIDGILNRGTEYDIEFLYRVVNGDPVKGNLLFNNGKGGYHGLTSDFGYTTATPCWMYLNDSLRYYGSVSSISVNHMMFDLNMVPIFSVVSLTFSRYPALWTDGTSTLAALTSRVAGSTLSTVVTPKK